MEKIIPYLDWFTMIATILYLWLAPKYRSWWLLCLFSNLIFAGLMAYKGLWGWMIGGFILSGIGLKNYLEK